MSTSAAYHEAGHAVVAISRGIPVLRCTIVPTRNTGGHVLPNVPTGSIDMHDLLVMWLAGGAAERRLTGKSATLNANDLAYAYLIASVMVRAEPGTKATADHLARYELLADVDVASHWNWIGRVAKRLLVKRTLCGGDVADLM